MRFGLDWTQATAKPLDGRLVVTVPFDYRAPFSENDLEIVNDAVRSANGAFNRAHVESDGLTHDRVFNKLIIDGVHLNAAARDLRTEFDEACRSATHRSRESGTDDEAEDAAARIQEELRR